MTQAQLADACGWQHNSDRGQARVSHYELNRRRPTLDDAQKLATLLHTSIDFLLKGKHTEFDTPWRYVPLRPWNEPHAKVKAKGAPLAVPVLPSVSIGIGKAAFAIAVKRAYAPDFHRGDIVVIDPDRKPKVGDFVLVRNRARTDIAKLVRVGKDCQLQMLNGARLTTDHVRYGVIAARFIHF
jgi:hypothetical protein